MKRLALLFSMLLLTATTVSATNTIADATNLHHTNVRGYGNSFIFNVEGIEFSVFADGQFDFYMPNYGPDVSVGFNSPGFSLSFNSGYDYNPYVQYDDFGAVVQIENTPIFYDYYGRVTQIGSVNIIYNGFGRINRVGGLFVHYRNRAFSHCSGFINIYNRGYVFRPWHRFYAVPSFNFCLISTRPYRQYYSPVRHTYYRPYRDNYRQPVRVNGRRGDVALNSGRRNGTTRSSISDRYVQRPESTRGRSLTSSTRSNTELSRPSSRSKTVKSIRSSKTNTVAPRPRTVTKKPKAKSSTRYVTKPRSSVSKKVNTRKNSSVRKPNVSKNRTYSKSKSQKRVTQNKTRNKSFSKSSKTRTQQKSKKTNSRRTRA